MNRYVVNNIPCHSSQHEKAVLYFQRALKLNPGYLSALTLMGHEYMEMKVTITIIKYLGSESDSVPFM